MIYKIQLRYLSCILYLFLASCGVSYDWDSDSQHLVNIDSLSVEDHLFYRCDAIYRKGTLLEWDMLAVSFCSGIDTINNICSGFSIYDKVNMSILDETTFQESLYAHVSKNIPIEVGSDLFAKYSQDKIVPCPEVTELYETKGIGAVLWRYMKGKHHMPEWSLHVEEKDPAQMYKELNLINYIIYLAFQHRIFFNFGEELTYWIDDKGFEIMEKARLEELAEKKGKEGVKLSKDSVK